ncbi:hypothetical protein ACWCWD_22660 [Streptomyces sp. NPDC001493]
MNIATSVQPGSFFDLARADQGLMALRHDGVPHVAPFVLMEQLVKNGIPFAEHARVLHRDTVSVSGVDFDWFDGKLPDQIATEINLSDYDIVEHNDDRRTALSHALERLANVHPEGFERVGAFVRGLLWVAHKPGVRASSLTSSSDPALPYIIVFSDKARHHIPPNTVSEQPSHLFLAENILHEGTHQSVSFHVLLNQVFSEEYSSATSPKIEIAWRSQSSQRNQAWEVDRAFHATVVYNQLIRFRRVELGRDDLTDHERACFQSAYDEGLPAVRYLMDRLDEVRHLFTEHGQDLLATLREQTDQL